MARASLRACEDGEPFGLDQAAHGLLGEDDSGAVEVGAHEQDAGADAVDLDEAVLLELALSQFGTSPDVVFLLGVRGTEATGIRFGDQYVRIKGGSITPLTKNAPSVEKFTERRAVEVKIVRTGDELQTWINGRERSKKKLTKKELDGKVGILVASNAKLLISRFRVTGVVDRSKI